MKRVLLKLSGEALAGDKHMGFDEPTVTKVAKQVKEIVDAGLEVSIVIGGGNFWRGRSSENIDRTKADQIGMLATVMNCIYVSEIFRSVGMKTQILTPFACGAFTKLFSKDRVNKYFEKGIVSFFAGGTGHPYFSTDTATVLRAIEIEADVILLAKSIDGVYDSQYSHNHLLQHTDKMRYAFPITGESGTTYFQRCCKTAFSLQLRSDIPPVLLVLLPTHRSSLCLLRQTYLSSSALFSC